MEDKQIVENPKSVTLKRSLKIWWSFMWRGWVMMFPLSLIVFPILLFISSKEQLAAVQDPHQATMATWKFSDVLTQL